MDEKFQFNFLNSSFKFKNQHNSLIHQLILVLHLIYMTINWVILTLLRSHLRIFFILQNFN